MNTILCEKCRKQVVKVLGQAGTVCACGALAVALVVTESIGVPVEDMKQLQRTYRDQREVVLRVPAALMPESFHVSVTSSGDWTIPIMSSGGKPFTLA